MCKAMLEKMNEVRSKTLHGRFEDKVEQEYGIRPYGIKQLNKAAGIKDNNKFYQKGGRGYQEPTEQVSPGRHISTSIASRRG